MHPESSPANKIEQRQEPRELCEIAVMVCDDEEGRTFEPAQMLDRSTHGVAFLFNRPIYPDQRFLLKLKDGLLSVSVYLARHCRQEKAGTYHIGGRLLRLVGEHEFKA
jgi:hypothetical protein